ncbi:hypothetical protein [Caproicibacterium amylolyticum]|uniref:Uncharacterized protein n=1 Tax=Caproicibacterium amylolyticum TaxID=2766537 RepID=A0A7G9WJI0_9FIRM|nr:hypothetical protein [Caproicibacterium amylolyticum]QNO18842.1 hypothetical protein H6X83_04190 [Caproicibacterium amylolyticum]
MTLAQTLMFGVGCITTAALIGSAIINAVIVIHKAVKARQHRAEREQRQAKQRRRRDFIDLMEAGK